MVFGTVPVIQGRYIYGVLNNSGNLVQVHLEVHPLVTCVVK